MTSTESILMCRSPEQLGENQIFKTQVHDLGGQIDAAVKRGTPPRGLSLPRALLTANSAESMNGASSEASFGSVFKDDDAFAKYRDRILLISSAVTIVLALPLVFINLSDGYYALAVAISAMVGVLLIIATVKRVRRNSSVTMASFLVSMLAVIYISIEQRGDYGIFWAYPAVLFLSFALSRRTATIYASILVVSNAAISFSFLEFGFALRAFVSLTGVVIFTNVFLSIIDILQTRLLDQSREDPLTGALNRRSLDENLGDAINRKQRRNIPATILILDIDHFKSLNDTYGHAVGDQVLQSIVAMVQDAKRHLDKLFRLGGEEFLLFLPDTPQAGAEVAASKILSLIAGSKFVEDRQVTVSIGLSELGEGETIENWMARADEALYAAKSNGRNQVVTAPPRTSTTGNTQHAAS